LCTSPLLIHPHFSNKNNINSPLFILFQKRMSAFALLCYVLVSHPEALIMCVLLVLVVRLETSLISLVVSECLDHSDLRSNHQNRRPTPPRFLLGGYWSGSSGYLQGWLFPDVPSLLLLDFFKPIFIHLQLFHFPLLGLLAILVCSDYF